MKLSLSSLHEPQHGHRSRQSRMNDQMQILPFSGIEPAPMDSPSISLSSSQPLTELKDDNDDGFEFHTEKGMKNESETTKCVTIVLDECGVFKRVMRVMEFYSRWVVMDMEDEKDEES
eukprot:996220_1